MEGIERPKRWRRVRLQMKNGETIRGRIKGMEKTNEFHFFLDTEFDENMPVDIRQVEEWIYEDNPQELK